MSLKSPSDRSSSAEAEPNETDLGSKPAHPLSGLYVVATPIGNLADMSSRALTILAHAGIVACEDTRVTRKLLSAHGLDRPLTAYHDSNAERVRPRLIEAMKQGKSVALVSDAGTPLVSDPGYKLVRAAIDAGQSVTPIPGASAVLAALVVSGLPSDRFFFGGFLPAKSAARRKVLAELAAVPGTLIFFESGRRLADSLDDMATLLAPRQAAVTRELTKYFEEVRRGGLDELALQYRSEAPPKGEIAIVLSPPSPKETTQADLDSQLCAALEQASLRDAAALVAAATGLPKRQVYARALALSGRNAP